MARCVFGVPLVLLLGSVASAQNPTQSGPQAVALPSQAIAAITNGAGITDVTGADDPDTFHKCRSKFRTHSRKSSSILLIEGSLLGTWPVSQREP